jgi:hypothetical protein
MRREYKWRELKKKGARETDTQRGIDRRGKKQIHYSLPLFLSFSYSLFHSLFSFLSTTVLPFLPPPPSALSLF